LLSASRIAAGREDARLEASYVPIPIGVEADQESRTVGMRLMIRIGQASDMLGKALPTSRSLDLGEQIDQRVDHPALAGSHGLGSIQHGLNGPTEASPEFDLAGDAAFHGLAGDARIEDQRI